MPRVLRLDKDILNFQVSLFCIMYQIADNQYTTVQTIWAFSVLLCRSWYILACYYSNPSLAKCMGGLWQDFIGSLFDHLGSLHYVFNRTVQISTTAIYRAGRNEDTFSPNSVSMNCLFSNIIHSVYSTWTSNDAVRWLTFMTWPIIECHSIIQPCPTRPGVASGKKD